MTPTRLHRLILAGACLLAFAAPAPAASQVREIRADRPVSGRLAASDPVLGDGSHYHLYVFRGTPGQRITVTLRSADFDAYLSGGTLENGSFDATESDDDGAGGTDARLHAVVGAGGAYFIRANSLSGGSTGAYTLTVERAGGAGTGASGGQAHAEGAVGTRSVRLLSARAARSPGGYEQFSKARTRLLAPYGAG